MTKDERLEKYEQELRRSGSYKENEIALKLTAFSRGYDEGYADGFIAGSNQQAEMHRKISEIFAGRA